MRFIKQTLDFIGTETVSSFQHKDNVRIYDKFSKILRNLNDVKARRPKVNTKNVNVVKMNGSGPGNKITKTNQKQCKPSFVKIPLATSFSL